MTPFQSKKRFVSTILAAALLAPYITFAQNNGYNFTHIDIPVEPVYDEGDGRYTETLWDVTDVGVYDENGVQVTEFEPDVPRPVQRNEEYLPSVPEPLDSFEEYRQSLISNWGGKKSFAEMRLEGVKENLEEQQKRFEELEKEIELAEETLIPIREQVVDLQGQIDLINTHIRLTKEKMTNVEVMIAEKKIEIKDAMLFLQRAEVELGIHKKVVLDYVKLLYEEENRFFDLYDDGASTLKLLLADASVSENLLGQEYFKVMEETGRQVFYDLDRKREMLQEKQDDILRQEADLNFLYEALAKEKRSYEETRLAKKTLLEETQGEEEKYQLLLEQALQEQLEAAIAVQNLQENVGLIEEKLSVLDDGLEEVHQAEAPTDFDSLQETKDALDMIDSIDGQSEEDVIKSLVKPFIWPVPANKITATFHDPTYPKKWGTHQAIDIRAKQFTEIRAPANSYVFQTKDSGNGYSYIVLAHKNNLVTVYGHVSEIKVTPGTIVKKGELIGLSGGTPGTKGAGLQTTGPHLHFEVWYKGQPVNPLNYLPLNEMPIEYVPDEFLSELK
ncbi:peptidoglycan DD-metalloendopeptidase family protein [Candidatus Peregrinibacteria bacterium]|nr:peptidoglycan DD-metalloendopeptidase family protein [Candidatus Peregrinibacteria bacterium]